MTAADLAKAVRDLEHSADLIIQAVTRLAAWDEHYDSERERRTASELYYKALALRLVLRGDCSASIRFRNEVHL